MSSLYTAHLQQHDEHLRDYCQGKMHNQAEYDSPSDYCRPYSQSPSSPSSMASPHLGPDQFGTEATGTQELFGVLSPGPADGYSNTHYFPLQRSLEHPDDSGHIPENQFADLAQAYHFRLGSPLPMPSLVLETPGAATLPMEKAIPCPLAVSTPVRKLATMVSAMLGTSPPADTSLNTWTWTGPLRAARRSSIDVVDIQARYWAEAWPPNLQASGKCRKNEWKRHVLSQHLILDYWLCTDPACVRSRPDTKGTIFNRKDLYTQHVRRMHVPEHFKDSVNSKSPDPAWEARLREMQMGARQTRCPLPEYMQCPAENCHAEFKGTSAWDDRMEHVARHLDKPHEPRVVFGGTQDDTLTNWAASPKVNIVRQVGPAKWELVVPLKTTAKELVAARKGNSSMRSHDSDKDAECDSE
ncbi:unnamed protein product [Parascedosporium putredinis]|uniref:C2H2-type domain-containing protein n=1 Tax=Parascedosporium putredinis TaxID=1442378 RepID=A0A9P1H359_9PEZI|nr:unnamed protein product [Parascedosporium putredinis]CAI7995443.1 unnamed protein product [Parascedosporium putredinis]